jgi:very-short-patch-repair endonuclease
MTPEFLTRADLLHAGYTRRSIQAAVRRGELVHVRRDRYLAADADEKFARAVRVGGRLTCLSLLSLLGVFVLENRRLHVHVHPTASRLRSPQNREKRLSARPRTRLVLHWTKLIEVAGSSSAVSVLDALAHSVLCQPPRAAVATLDSALNRGLISSIQLAELFAALPARFGMLAGLVDGRAESGPETLVRLMARMLGCEIQLQVEFEDIGRVDLVLDGWLVVECDSEQFHATWAAQVRDRKRDLALAALGYATLRLPAATIMYQPDDAFAALRGLVQSRRSE